MEVCGLQYKLVGAVTSLCPLLWLTGCWHLTLSSVLLFKQCHALCFSGLSPWTL